MKPYHGCGEMDEAFQMDSKAIVAGRAVPEVLHSAKASFVLITLLADFIVLGDKVLRFRRDGSTASAFVRAVRSRKSLLSWSCRSVSAWPSGLSGDPPPGEH